MQQRLLSFVNGIRDKWNELDRSGKIKIVISVAAVIIVLFTVIFIATRPKMTKIFDSLNYTEGIDAETVLKTAGIYSELKKGELFVKEADASRATYEITNSDMMSINQADKSFSEAMDLISMGTTESTKRDIMKDQQEKKLGNSLTMFNGVSFAKVTLYIPPDERFFLRSEERATAGVIITSNRDITAKEAQAMARYVCKSVKGLNMEDIEILNQNMETLYSGTKLSTDGYAESYELEMIKKNEIIAAVKSYVFPIYDDVKVMVTLDIDNDKLVEEVRSYLDPNSDEGQSGFAENVFDSSSSVNGSVNEGEPGVGANDNAAPTYQAGDDTVSSAKTKESQINYLYDQIIQNKEKAIGAINYNNSSLSVNLIKNRIYYEEDLSSYITQMSLPESTTWRQFQAGIDKFIPLEMNDNLRSLMDSIRIGTGIQNVDLIAYEQSSFIDMPVTAMPIQNYLMFIILAILILLLLYGFIKKTQQDEVTEIEPELSVEDLLVSTQLEEEKEAEAERLKEIAFNQESEAMKQIDTFIDERPEAVAQLLRNWLNEDWE